MKKIIFLGLSALAVLAMTIAPVVAGEGCADAAKASTAGTKSTCGAKAEGASMTGAGCGDKATATTASAHGTCNLNGQKLTAEECAKMMSSMTPEQCAKACGYEGKMEMVNMNIKGMTCGGCEGSVTAALEKTPGVVKVVSVNYKDGSALVCIDPAKTKAETLTQTVSNKGYEAQIIPAVATTGTTAKSATCSKTCSPAEAAACAAKDTKAKTGAEGSK
jgi:copper chaperone CopZ